MKNAAYAPETMFALVKNEGRALTDAELLCVCGGAPVDGGGGGGAWDRDDKDDGGHSGGATGGW